MMKKNLHNMMKKYQNGGTVKPFVTSDIVEYNRREQEYGDSLNIYKMDKLMEKLIHDPKYKTKEDIQKNKLFRSLGKSFDESFDRLGDKHNFVLPGTGADRVFSDGSVLYDPGDAVHPVQKVIYQPKEETEPATPILKKTLTEINQPVVVKKAEPQENIRWYDDSKEYEKALQASQDTARYVSNAAKFELRSENTTMNSKVKYLGNVDYLSTPLNALYEKNDLSYHTKAEAYSKDKIKPVAFKKWDIGSGTIQYTPIYQKKGEAVTPKLREQPKRMAVATGGEEERPTKPKIVTPLGGRKGTKDEIVNQRKEMTKKQFEDYFGFKNGGLLSMMNGGKAKQVTVGPSKIQGKGLFTNRTFEHGEIMGLAHVDNQPTSEIGKYHNHSDNPNSFSMQMGNKRFIAPLRRLKKGEEITVDYRQQPGLEQPEDFNKGGKTNLLEMSHRQGYQNGGRTGERLPNVPPINEAHLKRFQEQMMEGVKSPEYAIGVERDRLDNIEKQKRKMNEKASGRADYVPLESLLLPGTPTIKGIGKLANFAVDALNPVQGIRSVAGVKKAVTDIPSRILSAEEQAAKTLSESIESSKQLKGVTSAGLADKKSFNALNLLGDLNRLEEISLKDVTPIGRYAKDWGAAKKMWDRPYMSPEKHLKEETKGMLATLQFGKRLTVKDQLSGEGRKELGSYLFDDTNLYKAKTFEELYSPAKASLFNEDHIMGGKTIKTEAWAEMLKKNKSFMDKLPPEDKKFFLKEIYQRNFRRMYQTTVGEPYTGKQALSEMSPYKKGGKANLLDLCYSK